VAQSLWKPTAGLWGPAAFVAASVIGGAMQPSYDHRRFHISGLAAHGARSAPVMIPGFITLGIARVSDNTVQLELQRCSFGGCRVLVG
jgi:hypothetical protein